MSDFATKLNQLDEELKSGKLSEESYDLRLQALLELQKSQESGKNYVIGNVTGGAKVVQGDDSQIVEQGAVSVKGTGNSVTVTQTDAHQASLDLDQLLEKLLAALTAVNPEGKDAADYIAEEAKEVVAEAQKEAPNQFKVKNKLASLQSAAQNILSVTSTVGQIVGQLIIAAKIASGL